MAIEEKPIAEEIASQVAHDIRSPLLTLKVIESDLDSLPEDKRQLLRCAIQRISELASNLQQPRKTSATLEKEPLTAILKQLISEKQLEYRDHGKIEIAGRLEQDCYGLFGVIEASDFKRAISNLINNGVEALAGSGNVFVDLRCDAANRMVHVSVTDNGNGISPAVLPHLGNRGATFGKPKGTGLGLYQVRTAVESWGGKLSIESVPGNGTIVIMSFPLTPPPPWFAANIPAADRSAIVVLSADLSIHEIWRMRFRDENVCAHFFTSAHELAAYLREQTVAIGRSLFLIDHKLEGTSETGLEIITRLQLARDSILMTNRFDSATLRAWCGKLGIKILPKPLAHIVPIEWRTP